MHRLLGSPAKQLQQMKHCIKSDTALFLLNHQSRTLMGTFVAASEPDQDIVPGAFHDKFSAQVRAQPLDVPLMQVRLQERVNAGPKSSAQVKVLSSLLLEGEV